MEKHNAITIMYLLRIKEGLIKDSNNLEGIEKDNIKYDIYCIEKTIEELGG